MTVAASGRVTVTRDGHVFGLDTDGSSQLLGRVERYQDGVLWRPVFPNGEPHPALFRTRADAVLRLQARQELVDQGGS